MGPEPAPPAEATVLVVDDTPGNIAVLNGILKDKYRVRVANCGVRGLQAAVREPIPDLVLLDVMMPDMTGFEVLAAMRQHPALREVPVIFVTALDGTEDEARGLALGAADYVPKPIRPALVLARVAAQIELKRARERLAAQTRWLEAEVERRVLESERLRALTVRALAAAADDRAPETSHHILRTQAFVQQLCAALADDPALGPLLGPTRAARIVQAAPLHDIGNGALPDAILRKPGPLAPAERALMQTHTTLGASLLQSALRAELSALQGAGETALVDTAAEIALSHHERWDGAGYPHGLVGDAIPLAGRVMAVADVYDALISRRPHKQPWSVAATEEAILSGAGTQFDPRVVAAFARSREAFAEIAERFADPGFTDAPAPLVPPRAAPPAAPLSPA
jgi:putative two-component system response regulator